MCTTNSLLQYFDKLYLKAARSQNTDSIIFVRIVIEPELKDLKTTSRYQVLKIHWSCATLENAQKI